MHKKENKIKSKKSKSVQGKSKKWVARAHIKKFLDWVIEQRDAYPVIVFAVLPTLFFWTRSNIQELGPSLMTRTFFFSISFGLLFYMIWYFVFSRDKFKASILAIITTVVAFSYGQIFTIYQKVISIILRIDIKVQSHILLWVVLLLTFGLIVYLVRKKVKFSANIRNYLAIFATVLLVMNLYPLVKHWVSNLNLGDTQFGPQVEVINKPKSQTPDIYYFIFDRYANQKVLKDIYKYDNSPFLNSLKKQGFYVASDSTANYPFTTISLAISLNMGYVPESLVGKADSGLHYTLMKDKLENNKTALLLKKQGYSFVNVGPWWTATKYNKNADQDLYNPAGITLFNKKIDMQEHELLLFKDTLAWQLFNRRISLKGKQLFSLTFPQGESSGRSIHRQTILHQIETIKKVSKQAGPKFVFTHMLFPHDPYVLDENCNTFRGQYKDEYVVYLNQLRCANKKILEMVDYILKHNKTKPIIILQSDEGPYPKEFKKHRNDPTWSWGRATTEMLHQKAEILNAYYFPDENYSKLYQTISPVNSFRLIFDQYFGTKLGLIKDKHYFPESEKRRFFLLDMTNKFN